MRVRILAFLIFSAWAMPVFVNAVETRSQFLLRETSQPSHADQDPMFGGLIQIDTDQSDIFQWSPTAAAVLVDYEQSIEGRAQQAINEGEWLRVVGEFRGTRAAKAALDSLRRAGMAVRSDGRVVPLSQIPIMISIVAFTR